MKVLILPKEFLRYGQYDDYQYIDGELIVSIADTGNEVYNKLILIHALVEEMLTKAKGIKEEDISKYDAEHLTSEEPGLERDAPYKDAHLIGEGIERILCGYLGINWKDYEKEFE
jgi:hypothetical protein